MENLIETDISVAHNMNINLSRPFPFYQFKKARINLLTKVNSKFNNKSLSN